jgi:hypothetical protein
MKNLKLNTSGAAVVEENRRRSTREMAGTTGTIRRAAADGSRRETSHDITVANISLHGVGIRSAIELHRGEYYHVEIGSGPLQLSSRMRVVRCDALPNGYFDVGGEFC